MEQDTVAIAMQVLGSKVGKEALEAAMWQARAVLAEKSLEEIAKAVAEEDAAEAEEAAAQVGQEEGDAPGQIPQSPLEG